MRKTNKKGFTLVELLVVIAIIAIIAAVAVPVTITQIDKAKIGAAVEEANNVKNALNSTLTDLVVSADRVPANGKVAVIGPALKKDLEASFAKLEQVTELWLITDDKGDINVTIITKVDAKDAKDDAKGYVGRVAVGSSANTAPVVADNAAGKVAITYLFKGNKNLGNGTAVVLTCDGTAWTVNTGAAVTKDGEAIGA